MKLRMDLLRVKKKVVKSQDQTPVIQRKLNWIDLTGTERKFDFKEIRGKTPVVFLVADSNSGISICKLYESIVLFQN